MPRYKLTIEYDGTGLAGWQKQDDQPSVQGHLIEAIEKFCGEKVNVVGAGRTDAGVHALAQVAHMDLSAEHDEYRVMSAINFHLLPHNISVIATEKVSEDFNARFSATRRHYLYRIINRRPRLAIDAGRAWHVPEPLDIQKMQEAASLLVGTHDFSSFRDTLCQAKSPVKTLETLQIERHGEEVTIQTSARSFLHHQVRIMAGSLMYVGKGKWSVADMQDALEAKDRTRGGPTAPPEGLFFVKVDY